MADDKWLRKNNGNLTLQMWIHGDIVIMSGERWTKLLENFFRSKNVSELEVSPEGVWISVGPILTKLSRVLEKKP